MRVKLQNILRKNLVAFLLIGGVLTTTALFNNGAIAATPISNEIANAFYQNCASDAGAELSSGAKEELCTCTAAQMKLNMTVEDVQIMTENTEAGRHKLNKMLLDVYAPCMGSAVAEKISGQCMNDPKAKIAASLFDQSELCGCMGVSTGSWFEKEGRQLMAQLIKDNPFIVDPMTPIVESQQMKDASYQMMMKCVESGMIKRN
jgi:hypothetical protein